MNIEEINKLLSNLNPYTQKDKIRPLLILRRKLSKQIDKSVNDVISGDNLPAMLKPQA